jgi:hypothetical protein
MTKERLNTDVAFESILGLNTKKPEKEKAIENHEPAEQPKITHQKPIPEPLIPTTIYLTKKQRKALEIRKTFSDRVEDKDKSAIVRTALDVWLADELKQV